MFFVLRALSLILIFLFGIHQGLALSYSGKLVVNGEAFEGEADFHFSILDANNTQLWQSGLINGKTVPLAVNKGRYSIELGGELTRPLSESVFLFGPFLKLRVQVDLRDGKGLQSAGADMPIHSVALARSAQRAKQAKSAMIADSVLNGSVTDTMLSPELRETLALANDPERLKPENLSSSFRQYFANDLKPKFTKISDPEIENLGNLTLKAPQVRGDNIGYSWKKDGFIIPGVSGSSLEIASGDTGVYSVVATNLFGSDELAYTVAPPPPAPPPKPDVSLLIRHKPVASWHNTLYIDENRSLWGCGENKNGSLGLGHTYAIGEFTKITDDEVFCVSTRSNLSFFIKEDGSLWGMGSNNHGQLPT